MNKFIKWLERLNDSDTKVRAILRRSLSFEPSYYVAAYPFVEPFLKNETNLWRRPAFYLIAGLWAAHWRADRSDEPISLGMAAATHQMTTKSTSTERRFITLLDSDIEQLPHRLRQMVALLKDYNLDFENLLTGLLFWDSPRRCTQLEWARDFYRSIEIDKDTSTELSE